MPLLSCESCHPLAKAMGETKVSGSAQPKATVGVYRNQEFIVHLFLGGIVGEFQQREACGRRWETLWIRYLFEREFRVQKPEAKDRRL